MAFDFSRLSYHACGVLAVLHACAVAVQVFSQPQRAMLLFCLWVLWPIVLMLHPARSNGGFRIPLVISVMIMAGPLVFVGGFLLLSLGGHQ